MRILFRFENSTFIKQLFLNRKKHSKNMTIFFISIVRVAVVIFCILQRCGCRKEDQVTDWPSPENFQDRNEKCRAQIFWSEMLLSITVN